MQKISLLLSLLLLFSISFLPIGDSWTKENTSPGLVIVGRVPGQYLLSSDVEKTKHYLSYIAIKGRIITEIKKVSEQGVEDLQENFPSAKIILAKGKKTFDVLYPGLIDLHNHTKQNNLGIWSEAKGQFDNRFEWRAWGNYKKAVSGNMNPWIGYGRPVTCAAFRWSEMQALVLGTTYLQGPSSCVSNFAIHKVEDKNSYISNRAAVQSPTDIIVPNDMVFVWETLAPIIRKEGKSYEEALTQVLVQGLGDWKGCPGLKDVVTAENINTPEIANKRLGDKGKLKKDCALESEEEEAKAPNKFIRYVYWVHKTIASKKNYFLPENNPSAVITHLGEGRKEDPYNKKELEILELLGLVQPYVHLVHGLGIDYEGMKKMAQNKMGFIWSPFSNFLLYGETLDLGAIKEAEKETGGEILIALGSDWTPTGTKSVLEELIVARNYVRKFGLEQKGYDSEALYKMVTENPARMIRHWEIDEEKGEHGIGRLAVGAMASILALSNHHPNPYENLVWHGEAKDVNLVLVDGKPVYGNQSYLEALGYTEKDYELLPQYLGPQKELALDPSEYVSTPTEEKWTKAQKTAQLQRIADYAYTHFVQSNPLIENHCKFPEQKVFIHQDSLSKDSVMVEFQQKTKLNLDRFQHIQALLAVHILTQSRNRNQIQSGDLDYAVEYFQPLYSCNDRGYGDIDYLDRVQNMIKIEGNDTNEEDLANREALRKKLGLGSVPMSLQEKYPEPHEEH